MKRNWKRSNEKMHPLTWRNPQAKHPPKGGSAGRRAVTKPHRRWLRLSRRWHQAAIGKTSWARLAAPWIEPKSRTQKLGPNATCRQTVGKTRLGCKAHLRES